MRQIKRFIPIQWQNRSYEKNYTQIVQEEKKQWELNGCPNPPPHIVKQEIILDHATKFNCKVFIETGTYLGDTVFSQKNNFDRIISIELAKKLYTWATTRFKNDSQIEIFNGNSGDLLHEIMPKISSRTLLWLDGHFSGGITARGKTESPIFNELDAVFENNALQHIILIDDARLFIGKRDYPTMEELNVYVKAKSPSYSITTKNDIIILTN
jgi:hypothetical protein